MNSFWKSALGIGGTATVGAFLIWSIYKDWLSLPIFPELTQDQAFYLFVLLLILTFLAFLVLALIHFFRRPEPAEKNENKHIFDLHQSWNDVNEVLPDNLVGPDVTRAVRAMEITATSWNQDLVPKDVIIDSHFEDFDILYTALNGCTKVVPGFEKDGTTCQDLLTPNMHAAHTKMTKYKRKK